MGFVASGFKNHNIIYDKKNYKYET